MKKIIVLMSTYNGEQYLEEQLISILNQKKVDLELLVRDDGSDDKTKIILKKYEKLGKLKWYSGKNLKPAKSFLNLLKNCGKADYYAFADQDDCWYSNKLIEAIKKLEKNKSKRGKLYFSALNVVDRKLQPLFTSNVNEKISFGPALIKNQATGCTMVIDDVLRQYINLFDFDYVSMHDSLIYRIALLNNSYIYADSNSYILYRQHDNNVLGMSNNFLDIVKKRWSRFIKSSCESSRTAKELLKISDISDYDKKTLVLVSSYKKNIRYKIELLFSHRCKNNKINVNILYIIKLLFNKV